MRILKSHPLIKMVSSYLIGSSQQSKSKLSRFPSDKSNIFLHNGIPAVSYPSTPTRRFSSIPARKFSSSSARRTDPLGFVGLSFMCPYPPSILTSPFFGAFFVLVGMSAALFFATSDISQFLANDPTLAEILRRTDNIFLLFERFLELERVLVGMFFGNLDNMIPENRAHYYFVLQELVTVREALFNNLTELINSPYMELLPRPVGDRID